MKYKAIIFDMDGTIIDTENVWDNAVRNLLLQKNMVLPVDSRTYMEKYAIGLSAPECCRLLKEMSQSEEPLEVLIEDMIMHAKQLFSTGARFIDGFIQFHSQVLEHGLKTGVATNADNHTLELACSLMDLPSFFGPHIYNPIKAQCSYKPAPDLYLHAAQQLGIDPRECIAIEDSAHGIKAAQAAGMLCIGIGTSQDPEQIKHADVPVPGYTHINLKDLLGLL
jgi:HAD superfamily hydrolase (TIGR01509 family)